MNRTVLSCIALLVVPWLSGCCCCGPMSGGYSCGGSYGGYSDCLTYNDAYSSCNDCGPTTSNRGGCSNCDGGDGFSLPPEPTNNFSSPTPVPSGSVPYDTYYGPEMIGPEIVGPEYVPNGTEWQQVGPSNPVTPAAPMPPGTIPNTQAPTPIPAINGGVVVPPAAAPTSSSSSTGPMMPVAPPPPPEPVSQMRFRTYR